MSFEPEGVTVYKPGQKKYERSVATSNLLYRFTRPPWVVRPRNTEEVMACLKEAYNKDIRLTVKGGGHCYAGFSSTDSGVLMDLMEMKGATLKVDSSNAPEAIVIEGGARWGHAYAKLINGGHDGYIINGGRCPTVGVGGFILGGGLSPFGRSFGLGCDAVTAITIVVARGDAPDGRVECLTIRPDDTDANNRELFWALRGAGQCTFGIVTELEMDVQRLHDSQVTAGRLTYQPKREDMTEFMDTMSEFYTARWSNEMTIDSSWLCDLRQTDSELAVRFIPYYNGTKTKFDNEIDEKLVIGADVGKLLKRRTSAERSTRFLHETFVSQWSEETKKTMPTSKTYSIYTSFIFTNDSTDQIKKIICVIRNEMKSFRAQFAGEQGLLQVSFIHSGGAAEDKEPNSTAYPWREGVYHTYITMVWEDKWLCADMESFLTKFQKRLRTYSLDQKATFVNFPDRKLPKEGYLEAYYGGNVEKLKTIKAQWDRNDFWQRQQGISLPSMQSPRTLPEPDGEEDVVYEDKQWDSVPESQRTSMPGAIAFVPENTIAEELDFENPFDGGF
ncbi:hypothetical protein N8T08_008136 [Aspergillus melleus]|uniref:Uncharacterized protein n=1 Tax=Aspergillus melleus TaxID=138277 RepID=A0ACC3AWB3_9EURO|nr:hypothetical protein N8T08_008136 [Aspergillus melleus]